MSNSAEPARARPRGPIRGAGSGRGGGAPAAASQRPTAPASGPGLRRSSSAAPAAAVPADGVIAPPGPGFHMARDVGGVRGLLVVYNAFSEDLERRLFEMPEWPYRPEQVSAHAASVRAQKGATATTRVMETSLLGPAVPREVFEVVNALRDCGLAPDLQTPNFCLLISYAKGARFQTHFDSKYRWGEAVVGISLGADSVLDMWPSQDLREQQRLSRVLVQLPRRSVYVLMGQARYAPGWQHGIKPLGSCGVPLNAPAWNPQGLRRSLTTRSSRPYAQVALRLEAAACPPGPRREALLARARQQESFGDDKETRRRVKESGAPDRPPWQQIVAQERERVQDMMSSAQWRDLTAAHMPAADTGFPLERLPPAVQELYRAAAPRVPRRAAVPHLAAPVQAYGSGLAAMAQQLQQLQQAEDAEVEAALRASLPELGGHDRGADGELLLAAQGSNEDLQLQAALAASLAEYEAAQQAQQGQRVQQAQQPWVDHADARRLRAEAAERRLGLAPMAMPPHGGPPSRGSEDDRQQQQQQQQQQPAGSGGGGAAEIVDLLDSSDEDNSDSGHDGRSGSGRGGASPPPKRQRG